jgi:hypothetical protein
MSFGSHQLPRSSDCALEAHLEGFLEAAEERPFCDPDALRPKIDQSWWVLERKRLARKLLGEVKNMRDLPAEHRDWEPDALGD